jgi:hypothetical protein
VIGGGIFIKFASHASTPPTGGGGTGWKFVSTSKITEGNGTYATFNAYACTKPTTTQYYTVYEKLVTVTSTIKGGYVQATLDIAGSVALGTRVAAVKGNYSIAAQYTIYTPSSAVIKPGVQLNPTSPTGSNTTGGTTRVTANSLPYCP